MFDSKFLFNWTFIPEIDPIDPETPETTKITSEISSKSEFEGSASDENLPEDDLGEDDDVGDNDDIFASEIPKIPQKSTESNTETSTMTSTVTNTVATSIPTSTSKVVDVVPPPNANCPVSDRHFQSMVFSSGFYSIKNCQGVQVYSASATFNSIRTGESASSGMNLQMRAPLKDSSSPEFYIVSGLMKQTVSDQLIENLAKMLKTQKKFKF